MNSNKYNPFRPGAPVPPGIFAGRLAELVQIERCLYQTKNDRAQNLLISGERAIGKTSTAVYTKLIANGKIETFKNENLNFLTIHAIVKSKQSFDDLLFDLIFYTKNVLKSSSIKAIDILKNIWGDLDTLSLGSLISFKKTAKQREFSLGSDEFCYFIENLWDSIGKDYDGILFILDEVDRLKDFEGVASFLKTLFEKLNFDSYNRISFLMCGMPEVKDKLYKDHESVLRNFQPIDLAIMPEREAKEVINKALKGTGVKIEDDALEYIVGLAEGYPHFLQEIGYSAFEVDEDDIIDENDVTGGVRGTPDYPGSLKRLGRQYFDRMFHRDVKSDVYREILTIVAKERTKYVSRKKILSKFSKGKTVLGTYLSNLIERELLVRDKTRKGYYALPSHMFRVYIRLSSKIKIK